VTDDQPSRDTGSFLFTDMRAPNERLRTALIYDHGARTDWHHCKSAHAGSVVQPNLGNLGWSEALITSSSGNHFAARCAIGPGEVVSPIAILPSELPMPI
jgi:hypothetical protein